MDYSKFAARDIVGRLRERAAQYAELGDLAELFVSKASPSLLSRLTPNVRQEVILSEERELLVDIGLGIFLPMSVKEATTFCASQAARIDKEADEVEQAFAQQAAEEAAIKRLTDLTQSTTSKS